MKISIISPNLSSDISVVDMGVTYLATYLNTRTHHRAQIIDLTYHRKDWQVYLNKKIEKFSPDAIGISIVSMFMQYTRRIAKEIKARYNLPIVLGGYHATLCPEDAISVQNVDAVCIGDGEFPIEEYLNALEEKRSAEGISGMWVKENGRLIKNPLRELIQDLDSLPIPNYDSWEDIDRFIFYNGVIYFIGTRGCPFTCTYCSEFPMRDATPGKHFRIRDPRAYAREIKSQWEKYKDRGMRVAHTFDPVFTINKKWLQEFCEEYISTGLSKVLPFSCFARADTIDEEKVEMLAAANCKVARIGVEAGNERIRMEVYDKKIPNEQYRKVFRWLHNNGIAVTGYNILGGPGETMKTMRDTFNLAKELNIDRPIFFTYRPLPKTQGAKLVTELGGKIDQKKWEEIDSLHENSNVYTGYLTPAQIVWFRRMCLSYFMVKRMLGLIKKQKHRFFLNLVKYFYRGYKDGISTQYIVGYFMVAGGENTTS